MAKWKVVEEGPLTYGALAFRGSIDYHLNGAWSVAGMAPFIIPTVVD